MCNIHTVIRLTLLLAFSMAMPQTALAKQLLDKVVAVVNKDVITASELENYTKFIVADLKEQGNVALPPSDILREQVLNRMIIDQIQMQLAQQNGIEIDSITVSEAIQQQAKHQGKSVDQLKNRLQAQGIKFTEYRELVRKDLLIQRLQAREIASDIVIAKSDIDSFLSSAAGQDNSGSEYRLSHILLPSPENPTPAMLKETLSKADNLVASLKKDTDFAKAAMSKSVGRQALSGGDLGWRNFGEIPTLFVNYVPSMKVGDIVGPIRSASGFHIIKLTDKRTNNNQGNVETHVRQILIIPDNHTSSNEARDKLLALRQQIVNGADFAKIAQKKSQDVHSAAKGGDMGWVDTNNVLPKFYQVMSSLKNNELSEPFQTEEGWSLIQVLDRRNQYTSSEAARNRAVEILTIRKANEAIETWTKRIRDEAQVKILT